MNTLFRTTLCALVLSSTLSIANAGEASGDVPMLETATDSNVVNLPPATAEMASPACEVCNPRCDFATSRLHDNRLLLDDLRDLPLFDCVTFSTGGQIRHRFMGESDRLRPGGPGRSTYDLWRWRHFAEVNFNNNARVYVEGIDASIFNQDLPVLAIDKNRWDLLNAYAEVRLPLWNDTDTWYRYGRQELQYGKQRLVSPLDWANTRRNFQGHRLYMTSGDWSFDLFTVNPVNSTARELPAVVQDNEFDRPGHDVSFSGLYTTYTGIENRTLDLYWLWKEDDRRIRIPVGGRRHTIGLRYGGTIPVHDCCCNVSRIWDFDMEGAYQFGSDAGADVSAGFFTASSGHRWTSLPWKPRVGGLFYWGSGDDDPNDNESNTFDVLYPLGHAYWGIIDNLSGQNLLDYSLQADVKPTDKLTLLAAYHFFERASSSDRAYNVARIPFGAVGGSRDIGEELDLIATYNFNKNFSVQLGYSWFWYGAYVNQNLPRDDAEQLYVMTTLQY